MFDMFKQRSNDDFEKNFEENQTLLSESQCKEIMNYFNCVFMYFVLSSNHQRENINIPKDIVNLVMLYTFANFIETNIIIFQEKSNNICRYIKLFCKEMTSIKIHKELTPYFKNLGFDIRPTDKILTTKMDKFKYIVIYKSISGDAKSEIRANLKKQNYRAIDLRVNYTFDSLNNTLEKVYQQEKRNYFYNGKRGENLLMFSMIQKKTNGTLISGDDNPDQSKHTPKLRSI